MERLNGGIEKTWLRDDGKPKQGLFCAQGVALARRVSPSGDLTLIALLKEQGLKWIKLPGAAKGSKRFGATVEPLVFGEYHLRQTLRGLYLQEVDVKEDFWDLRTSPSKLKTALGWARDLSEKLLSDYPFDGVLTAFYWGLVALRDDLPPLWVGVRFYWRWLHDLGMAPNFVDCPIPLTLTQAQYLQKYVSKGKTEYFELDVDGKKILLWLESLLN